ncbi:MAG: RibD family protein [Pleurocapsa sp.]
MNNRPKTTVVLGMTADGKIADQQRSPARFGSSADKIHLETQVSLVDGVIFGANTLRAYGTTLSVTNPQLLQERQGRSQPSQPVQIVVSATGNFDSELRFFKQPVPRWLLTTNVGAKTWWNRTEFSRIIIAQQDKSKGLSPEFDSEAYKLCKIDWIKTLEQLYQLGVKKLAILGGGELVASLLAFNVIDELWLTVCPIILGGRNSPTPVEGIGLTESQSQKLQLLEVKQIDSEVFLHYLVVNS